MMARKFFGCFEIEFKEEKFVMVTRNISTILMIGRVNEEGDNDYAVMQPYSGEICKERQTIGVFSDVKFLNAALLEIIDPAQNIFEGKLIEVQPRVYCQEKYMDLLYPGWDGLQEPSNNVSLGNTPDLEDARMSILRLLQSDGVNIQTINIEPKKREIH